MNTTAFTAARVLSFDCPPEKSQALYWDAKTPGLGLRVTGTGARSYVFESRLFGKSLRITIGDARAWDLAKARTEAARLKTVVDSGIDPREQRSEQKAAHEARKAEAVRKSCTVEQAWREYLEERRPHWSERHYQDHLLHADRGGTPKKRGKGTTQAGPLAELMSVQLVDLSGNSLGAWMSAEGEVRPTMAALSFRLLRAFIRWCEDTPAYKGLIPEDAYKNRKVKNAVPRVKAREGDVLQREQLKPWFAAVRALPSQVMSAYLQGLLITGARREELAALRWETDVDLKWRTLTLNDKVEGTGGRTIPLTPYLTSLLKDLQDANNTPPNRRRLAQLGEQGKSWQPSPWVFSSTTSEDGRMSEPRIAHVKALQAAGLPHLTLHGLRRSFGTLSEWCEVPVGVVAQIQGHKPSAIAEKHYRRRPIDLLRKWHDQIEAWLIEQGGIEWRPADFGQSASTQPPVS